MIEAILPAIESGPYLERILLRIIKDEDDDIGLRIAMGKISLGKYLKSINFTITKIILLFVRTVTAIIIANILGNISRERFKPSFTPFKNSS
jgi:hypothetical protein